MTVLVYEPQYTAEGLAEHARVALRNAYGLPFSAAAPAPLRAPLALVSGDGRIVGDALYGVRHHRGRVAPARLAAITERVWLLERTPAEARLLVFLATDPAPREWLRRYGHVDRGVRFLVLGPRGLEELRGCESG